MSSPGRAKSSLRLKIEALAVGESLTVPWDNEASPVKAQMAMNHVRRLLGYDFEHVKHEDFSRTFTRTK